MARKVYQVILIMSLLASAHLRATDWVTDLKDNINRMVDDLKRQTQNLNTEIQNTVQSAIAQANEALKDLPRDDQGRLITNGQVVIKSGSSIIINSGGSMTIVSGTKNGMQYVDITEERTDGNYLYHNQTIIYNSDPNTIDRIRWRKDLTNPNAPIEYLPTEQ